MTKDEALRMALEAMEDVQDMMTTSDWFNQRVDAIRQVLAEPEMGFDLAGTPIPNKEEGSASGNTDPEPQQNFGVSSNYSLHDDDLEALFNLRNWLESCLEYGNAKITGSGMGFGGVDLVFKLDGYSFYVECKPRKKHD